MNTSINSGRYKIVAGNVVPLHQCHLGLAVLHPKGDPPLNLPLLTHLTKKVHHLLMKCHRLFSF
jgi:hypothetical protein